MSDNILDVAVVGGGISGVYSAWRLLTDGGKKSVTVYEADKHIGGRLLSVKPPCINNMVAELGGMRILPASIQPLVNTLIWKLNDLADNPQSGITQIDLYDFPVNEGDASNNIVFTRGKSFRWSSITDPNFTMLPYELADGEKHQSLGNIILQAILKIIPGIDKLPPEEQRRKAQSVTYGPQNLPLYQQGFWDVLTQVVSYEAYKFEQDAGGYLTTLSNWNAADAIPWFLADFGSRATYRGFAQGYRQVVVNMAQLFTNAGGNIVCNQKLASFDWDGKAFTLKFANGNTVKAKAIILAMPRRSLELISCGNQYLSDHATSKLIKSVTPKSAFKIFSTYPTPWWQKLNLSLGRSVNDLPLRQTYYWTDSQGKPIKDGQAMLMASYDDGTNTEFWDGYRDWSSAKWKAKGLQKTEKNAMKWTDEAPQWSDYEAPPQMRVEMTRQLAKIHGVPEASIQPNEVSFKDWAEDPFGGGWNFWNIGVESPKVMKSIIKPNSTLPLYICGDAYSNWQGWVEGALETANMVLALPEFKVEPLSEALKIISKSLPNAPSNYPYTIKLEAVGGTFPFDYEWTVTGLPTGLTFDPTTGVIQGTAQVASGMFPLSITVSQGGNTNTQTLSLQVVPTGEIEITTASLPGAPKYHAYYAKLEASGGKPPFHYTWKCDGLPSGLTLDSTTGVIGGSPHVPVGEYSVQVVASQNEQSSPTKTFKINVWLPITASELETSLGQSQISS